MKHRTTVIDSIIAGTVIITYVTIMILSIVSLWTPLWKWGLFALWALSSATLSLYFYEIAKQKEEEEEEFTGI